MLHEEVRLPDGSIYFWMYTQGLKHVDLSHILDACRRHARDVREKDVQNYWNGWYRSQLYMRKSVLEFPRDLPQAASKGYFERAYQDYPVHPFLGKPDPEQRYVPCNAANKPMIKWGNGCLSRVDALSHKGAVYLGENTKGCKFIVIDCDGDHDDAELDLDTIEFLSQYRGMTHCLSKPKRIHEYPGYEDICSDVGLGYASFHLTFRVDREIPTMHFPKAHIDIVGNKTNSLRYFKDKVWNGAEAADMTPAIWEELKAYIRRREEGNAQSL